MTRATIALPIDHPHQAARIRAIGAPVLLNDVRIGRVVDVEPQLHAAQTVVILILELDDGFELPNVLRHYSIP